jgi:hypothetical protein
LREQNQIREVDEDLSGEEKSSPIESDSPDSDRSESLEAVDVPKLSPQKILNRLSTLVEVEFHRGTVLFVTSLSLCLSLSLFVSVSLSLSASVSLDLSLSLSVSVCLCLSLSLSLSLFLKLCLPLFRLGSDLDPDKFRTAFNPILKLGEEVGFILFD